MPGSDSATLFHLADHLDEQAAEVRAQAHRLGLAAADLRWHSAAAGLFRQRVAGLVAGLNQSAHGLDRSAAALRRHARTVRRLEEVARSVEQAADTTVNGARRIGRTMAGWL